MLINNMTVAAQPVNVSILNAIVLYCYLKHQKTNLTIRVLYITGAP